MERQYVLTNAYTKNFLQVKKDKLKIVEFTWELSEDPRR